jgi:hypothetical protein
VLFVAKRDERVDSARAVRGEQCRQRRHDSEERCYGNEGLRIELLLETANEAHGRDQDALRDVGRGGRPFGNEKKPMVARRHR